MLTGRRIVYMNRFRPERGGSANRRKPIRSRSAKWRASEVVIDAEVVDLPDEPPPQIGAEKR